MSIDTGAIWSASSLQAPVHAQMNRLHNATRMIGSRMQNRVAMAPLNQAAASGSGPSRTPFERSILTMGTPGITTPKTVLPADGAGAILEQQAGKPLVTPGTNVVQQPVKVTQPGIDADIATAIPTAKDEGIPKMNTLSGWLTPGANLTR